MSDQFAAFVEFLVNSFKREAFALEELNPNVLEFLCAQHAKMLAELEKVEEGNFVLEIMISYLHNTARVLRAKGFSREAIQDNFVLFFQGENFVFGKTKASFETKFFDEFGKRVF